MAVLYHFMHGHMWRVVIIIDRGHIFLIIHKKYITNISENVGHWVSFGYGIVLRCYFYEVLLCHTLTEAAYIILNI